MYRFLTFLFTLSTILAFGGDMTLEECISRTLSSNLDITLQTLSTQAAQAQFEGAAGIFDPTLTTDLSKRSSKSPSAWQLAGATVSRNESDNASIGVNQLLPTGGALSLTLDATKSETNSSFYTVNPYYGSTFTLGISQSLLKGFGSDIARYRIIVNRHSYNTSMETLRQQILTTLLNVENAYWDLKSALSNLEVKKKDLELARELLEDTQKRIDVGTQAPIDIYQAEVGVATRKEQIIQARARVATANDTLKALLNETAGPSWDDTINPIDVISIDQTSFNPEESLQEALKNRPDMRMILTKEATTHLDYIVAKNSLLPSLDMKLSYGYSGMGGDYIVRDPLTGEVTDVIPGGISDAFDQVKDRLYNNWSAALTFSFPIGNRDARAQKKIAQINLEHVRKEKEQLQQTIFASVRNALRSIETARESLEAAESSKILAEKNLDADRKKYDNGMVTSFQVLEVEADLSEARTREIEARINYRKAIASYHYTIGDLFTYEGLEIEEPQPVGASRWENVPVLSYQWWVKDDGEDEDDKTDKK